MLKVLGKLETFRPTARRGRSWAGPAGLERTALRQWVVVRVCGVMVGTGKSRQQQNLKEARKKSRKVTLKV